MNDPMQLILQAGGAADPLPPGSRYHGVGTARLVTTAGKTVVYLRRRFVPPPERFAVLTEHVVAQGERLDNVTFKYLGDPEQFWRICDANGAMRPDDLVEVGSVIRITLPEGIPGPSRA